jgi:HEAT repeat protein
MEALPRTSCAKRFRPFCGPRTALGNAGDSSTLDTIRPFVSSGSPVVRAAAAQALRRIPGPDADRLLAQLCADSIANVRYSAVDAVSERPASDILVGALLARLAANRCRYRRECGDE